MRTWAERQSHIHRHTAQATPPDHPEMAAWQHALADAYLTLATEGMKYDPDLLPVLGQLVDEITKVHHRLAAAAPVTQDGREAR